MALEPVVKSALAGFGTSIGGAYAIDFYAPKIPALQWLPAHIEPLFYGGALLTFALGLISSEHHGLAVFGLSLGAGFWLYQHYLVNYFLKMKH